jgi:polar amino acid transport system substrate-binding protein
MMTATASICSALTTRIQRCGAVSFVPWIACLTVLFAQCIFAQAPAVAASPQASAQRDSPRLRVLTRAVPPFAFQSADGKWQGIAIELWERIAADMGVAFDYQAVTLPDLLDGLATGKADLAVGALSVTAAREELFDFTHPFYRAGLSVAVRKETGSTWPELMRAALSPRFMLPLAGILALLASVGALIWFFERRTNTQFPRDPVRGIAAGMWFSSVTMTTVGYGDKAPISTLGRIVTVIWMFTSVVLTAIITASLTASLTLGGLTGQVQSESDLIKVRTATVAGSTSETRLRTNGVSARTVPDLSAALEMLARGEVDAVVYDAPLLRYQINARFAGSLHVLNLEFEPQDYAIGVVSGSALTEALNRRLLRFGRGAEWEALVKKYLGT